MKKSIENIVRHSEVSEKAIEAYLNKRCKENGLLCLKCPVDLLFCWLVWF